MSRPRDIVKRIAKEAKRQNGEGLTEQIYRECQPKLGKGWWRR